MANLPLNPDTNPEIQALLESLAPNVMPAPPSFWPLAVGYWLIILTLLISVTVGLVFWYRNRHWRRIHKELKQIRTQPNSLEHLHRLLRWVLISQLNLGRSLNDTAFALRVTDTLGSQPDWVNAHYRADAENIVIDWQQINRLLALWKKEARR